MHSCTPAQGNVPIPQKASGRTWATVEEMRHKRLVRTLNKLDAEKVSSKVHKMSQRAAITSVRVPSGRSTDLPALSLPDEVDHVNPLSPTFTVDSYDSSHPPTHSNDVTIATTDPSMGNSSHQGLHGPSLWNAGPRLDRDRQNLESDLDLDGRHQGPHLDRDGWNSGPHLDHDGWGMGIHLDHDGCLMECHESISSRNSHPFNGYNNLSNVLSNRFWNVGLGSKTRVEFPGNERSQPPLSRSPHVPYQRNEHGYDPGNEQYETAGEMNTHLTHSMNSTETAVEMSVHITHPMNGIETAAEMSIHITHPTNSTETPMEMHVHIAHPMNSTKTEVEMGMHIMRPIAGVMHPVISIPSTGLKCLVTITGILDPMASIPNIGIKHPATSTGIASSPPHLMIQMPPVKFKILGIGPVHIEGFFHSFKTD
ncbi:hypothetical protein BS47DRAFT_1367070 [Hydnum rufescens UP504]|uniref:Uncharacterized protein n=1 Tax=Hydnum rufescens UP504 TaxID=1448309 RepID=A0A9P6AJF8_9AGAM|nr:hypothetical protein BS47DRAFT_1367070 [Hydnum rufescens UP504]